MKMQKLSLLAALTAGALIALTSTLQAQENKPDRPARGPRAGQNGEGMKERFAKVSEELKLTDEQKTKVEAAMKQQAETARGLRDATPEERREKMQAARKAFDGKMKEILTADQYAKWEKTREQRGGEGRRGGPGGPGGAGNRPEKKN
jgi:Spy/CpxP family protein refolding chaperone